MKLALRLALRYLTARKSHRLVNVISLVSIAGVAVGTMGLIIVLSVFNGFGNLVISLYNSFDPDIRITDVNARSFSEDAVLINAIRNTKGVETFSSILEDNALLQYDDKQFVTTIKGVDSNYFHVTGLKDKIVQGNASLYIRDLPAIIPGAEIAWSLGINPDNPFFPVNVFMPLRVINPSEALMNPAAAFRQREVYVSGIFSVQQDFDSRYSLVPLNFMQELCGREKEISAIEIKLKPHFSSAEIQSSLKKELGNRYTVKTREQLHDFLFKILSSEKLAVYLILGFILMIASFNLFGTMAILIMDKRNEITTLMHLGANLKLLRHVFMIEGLMVTLTGAFTGMSLGALICFLQQRFGFVHLEHAEGFIIQSYPVAMQLKDFLIVSLLVLIIGFVSARFTSLRMVQRQLPANLVAA